MCGINGVLGCGDRAALDRMNRAVAHRGPDDQGMEWFAELGSGLGHRRLSIIDLSASGHQPMSCEAGRHWITFNGEIYNHAELRGALEARGHRFRSASDTEVLLRAYLEWGEGCLSRLNGMLAFAVLDRLSGELFAARDRLGVKPFYYWTDGRALAFSSEIKALLASGIVPVAPDEEALATPTRFQVAPRTGFRAVSKLSPGHFLRHRGGPPSTQRYWRLEPREDDLSFDAAVERLDELVSRAVRRQLVSDVEVGAFLSGGLDSSLACALAARESQRPLRTYTIRFRDDDARFEAMPDDSVHARRVAEHFGFEHRELIIEPDVVDLLPKLTWHLDEPVADPAAINTYLISKQAREQGTVVLLNGMGGDEVFGGYRSQLACLLADRYRAFAPDAVRDVVRAVVERLPVASGTRGHRRVRWLKRFLSFASLPRVERALSSDLSLNPSEFAELLRGRSYHDTHFYRAQAPTFEDERLSYLTRVCLNSTQVFLAEHNLMYSDKATMAAGVESRPPLTDHEVVEFAFTLPPGHRIRGRQQKAVLKAVGARHLPHDVAYRPKAPFASPLRAWIRGPLRELVDDCLSEGTLRRRGIYDPRAVRERIRRDRDGREDNAHLIWQLLTVETWFRTFFDSALEVAA